MSQAVFGYEEATLADPAVAASYVDSQLNILNTYYELINQRMLKSYQRFACRTRKISTIAANKGKTKLKLDDQLVNTVNTLLSYALNDYGSACLNYYLRFEVRTSQDAKLRKAVGLLEKSAHLLEKSAHLPAANSMVKYNLFCACAWAYDNEPDELTELVQKSTELSPTGLAPVLTQLGEHLRAEHHDEKQLKELEKPLLDLLRKTNLAPFAEYLSSFRIGELLKTRDFNWSLFGDREVSALMALAQFWGNSLVAPQASQQLCKHILKFYYPESFDVIRTLSSVMTLSTTEPDERQGLNLVHYVIRTLSSVMTLLTTEPGERERLNSVMDEAIDWSISYDLKSLFFKQLRLERCNESVSSYCKDWPYQFSKESRYQQAIEKYKEAEKQCAVFPAFHNYLAFAYEYSAKQLAGNNGGRDRAIDNSKLVLQERREACRLDPKNPEYRDKLLVTLGRQLIAGNTFEDPLEQRTVPNPIEVELASGSIPDLGFPKTGLPAELQQKITDVRNKLKTDAGFVLPVINFRDDASFERGQFRFLIRGVPLPDEKLDPKAPQNEQWDELTGASRK